jgi:hypothetical protein
MDMREHLKDEWEFHKRHPEMFLVWLLILVNFVLAVIETIKNDS